MTGPLVDRKAPADNVSQGSGSTRGPRAVEDDTDPDLPLARGVRQTATCLWNDSADPVELTRSLAFGATGATCNPVIALTTISAHLPTWGPRIRALAAAHPTAGHAEIGWLAVEALTVDGAALLHDAFLDSHGRNGRLSIQTDPGLHRDADALVAQARRFAALADNIIVKIPATAVGLRAIEEAVFAGVSVNVTVSFTVAQAVRAAEAIERGTDRRRAAGFPDREAGHVVTIMGGRLDDWLRTWVQRHRVLMDPGHLEWAGVAVCKEAYRQFVARGFGARLLVGAFRNHFLFSQFVGGDLVITAPFDWQLRINENRLAVDPHAIDTPVAPDILASLRAHCPDFVRAFDVDGLTVEEFDSFPVTRLTMRQFLEADAALEALVRDVLIPAP